VGELDEDERDRRNFEEIQRRIEGRRVAKELESLRTDHASVEKSTLAIPTVPTSDVVKTADARVVDDVDAPGERRTSTKAPKTPK